MTAGEASRRLDELRAEIERADRDIVEAIGRRQRLVEAVGGAKADSAAPLRDRAREREVLKRVEAVAREAGLDPFFITRLFCELIDYSIRTQQARLLDGSAPDPGRRLVVGYQGTESAYGHQAALRYFSPRHANAQFRAYETFRDTMDAVRRGEVDYAVLPIENTTAGSINETYDLLTSMDLALVGEEIQPIDHCVIGVAPGALSSIRRIYSHPQALAQCSEFLATLPQCSAEPFGNTALAVEKIVREGDPTQAAIASEEAARRAGGHVLARDIANQRENFTRFAVVAAEPIECDARVPCKTSVMFVTRHERGALVACLNVLSERGLNLTKLESRPRPGTPWEYQFYVDFEGNRAEPRVQEALRELAARSFSLKVFGSYPARTTAAARVEQAPQS